MAKASYKVATSLKRGWGDHEISIHSSLPSTPFKQIGFIGGGLLAVGWSLYATWISSAGVGLTLAYVLWAGITIVYLGMLSKTRELRVSSIPALVEYLPHKSRHVLTRRGSDPSHFGSIVGIEEIAETGRITYADSRVGQMYFVVGSASHLLFNDDRVAILDRNDSFWCKVDHSSEWIWITNKEPQRIDQQVAALEERNQQLQVRDPDLVELLNEQYDILTGHVGGNYSSIQQYLLLQGDSADSLERMERMLRAEVGDSALMLKEATPLDREETHAVLRVFYTGTYDELVPLQGPR